MSNQIYAILVTVSRMDNKPDVSPSGFSEVLSSADTIVNKNNNSHTTYHSVWAMVYDADALEIKEELVDLDREMHRKCIAAHSYQIRTWNVSADDVSFYFKKRNGRSTHKYKRTLPTGEEISNAKLVEWGVL